MSYPSQSPYPAHGSYTPPSSAGGPPRRNLALVGGIVVASTALVLGLILLTAFIANRSGDDSGAEVAAEETTSGAADEDGDGQDVSDATASNDPEEVAVAVAEILYGLSDASAEGLICADPGYSLVDVEATGAIVAESLGDLSEVLEGVSAVDSYEQDGATIVEIALIASGVESPAGTVELVVEDGLWKACDITY